VLFTPWDKAVPATQSRDAARHRVRLKPSSMLRVHRGSLRGLPQGNIVSDVSVAALSPSPDVEVVEAREVWSEYRLADGTVLRVKPILISITRVEGAEAGNGEPVYNMKSTLVTDVKGGKPSPDFA